MAAPSTGVRHPPGFTLVEMLVVLVVLGMIGGLVLARGPTRSPTVAVNAAATALAATLRSARADAIVSGTPVRLEVDLPTSRITGAVLLGFSQPVGGRATVVFAPDGSASGGSFALSAPPARAAVAVDAFTGRVSIGG